MGSLTILHHAEHIAEIPNKRIERFKWPMLVSGARRWVEIEQFDTSAGIADWPDGDYFIGIAEDYLKSGRHRTGKAGAADSYLFDADDLTAFAVSWIEKNLRRHS